MSLFIPQWQYSYPYQSRRSTVLESERRRLFVRHHKRTHGNSFNDYSHVNTAEVRMRSLYAQCESESSAYWPIINNFRTRDYRTKNRKKCIFSAELMLSFISSMWSRNWTLHFTFAVYFFQKSQVLAYLPRKERGENLSSIRKWEENHRQNYSDTLGSILGDEGCGRNDQFPCNQAHVYHPVGALRTPA